MNPTPLFPSSGALRRLAPVADALSAAASVEDVARLGLHCASGLFGAERGLVVLPDDQGVFRVASALGLDPSRTDRFGDAFDEALSARIEALFGLETVGRERLLAAPLIVRGRTPGVLALDRTPDQATDDEGWLLVALADEISIAIEKLRGQDVHARLEKDLREALLRTERALDVAKHDVRTPLNAILGYLELLSLGSFGTLSDAQKDVLERVRGVSTHLHGVLENALLTASEQGDAARAHTGAAELIREAVDLVVPSAGEKGIRVELELEEGAWLACEAHRFRQALVNVLDNAVKYGPTGSRVKVTLGSFERGGVRWCAIEVADGGPGIPPEHREDVFAFGRRIAGRGDDPGGSGIGLFVARSLVQGMGGLIRVEARQGPGTVVRIEVPAEAPPGASRPGERPH